MGTAKQAFVVVPLVIGTLTGVFAILAVLLLRVFGVPGELGMPPALRIGGGVVLLFGAACMVWTLRYRSPLQVVTSTYATMREATRGSVVQPASRGEPLTVQGPHRYVRHPLYFAVLVLFIGWWLLLDRTVLLIMSALFFLWFRMVVIRFEERELRALFGDEFDRYAKAVPMLLPWPTRRS